MYKRQCWEDIRVPAHIQMEGYDIPQYVNIQYPWDGREDVWRDAVPSEFNPVASYVKYFTLPEGFRKNGLYISFQGVESGFALWLNGHYVGYSEDSFTPSDFDLTPYVKEGENKMCIRDRGSIPDCKMCSCYLLGGRPEGISHLQQLLVYII